MWTSRPFDAGAEAKKQPKLGGLVTVFRCGTDPMANSPSAESTGFSQQVRGKDNPIFRCLSTAWSTLALTFWPSFDQHRWGV